EYVVPPLEGFWYQEGLCGVDYSRKDEFCWTSVIRVPDFVTEDVFGWAVKEAERKKRMDLSKVEFITVDEGLCVQVMHTGPFDDEPTTVKLMDDYALSLGYETDFSDTRFHHEIYLSDFRKTATDKLRTVIRHPIRKSDGIH
ncbi:MAG: GyrI-like domain-containing protein, partial [Bullifex sp.]